MSLTYWQMQQTDMYFHCIIISLYEANYAWQQTLATPANGTMAVEPWNRNEIFTDCRPRLLHCSKYVRTKNDLYTKLDLGALLSLHLYHEVFRLPSDFVWRPPRGSR